MAISVTPSGGPSGEYGTYTPLYVTTLTSTAEGVTFSNIPTIYTDLVIVATAQSNVTGSDINNFRLRLNDDTSSNYSDTIVYSSVPASTAGSSRDSSSSVMYVGAIAMTSATAKAQSTIHIMNYSNTTTYKTVLARGGLGTSQLNYIVGTWRSTSPVTSVTLSLPSSLLAVGTSFAVYGVKAAIPSPKATGGDIITTDGTYWYHAFKTSGVFDVRVDITADILVIAGGGGGGYGGAGAGGGGAGGLLAFNSQALSLSGYTVTVGAGGPGGTVTNGLQGANSRFGSLTECIGGGYGGGSFTANDVLGGNGGSGGGGGAGNTNLDWGLAGGSPTSGQGYAGAASLASEGGGGGGAGAAGSTRNGGNGLNTWSAWATATSTGVSGYYAGGGGGSKYPSSYGTGGAGGGGQSGQYTVNNAVAENGVASTGSGGGGGGYANNTSTSQIGGAGGSGIVIVRYPV